LPTRDGNVIGIPKAELSTTATGTVTGTKTIIVGGFEAGYLIADRRGMSVELVTHLFGASNRYPVGARALRDLATARPCRPSAGCDLELDARNVA
jgi:HK97 family phage major capsid protein